MAYRTTATITMRVTVAGSHKKRGIPIKELVNKFAVFDVHSIEQSDIEVKDIGLVDHAIKEISFLKNLMEEMVQGDPASEVWYKKYAYHIKGKKRLLGFPSINIMEKIYIYLEDGHLVVQDNFKHGSSLSDPVRFELAKSGSTKEFLRYLIGLTNQIEEEKGKGKDRAERFKKLMEDRYGNQSKRQPD